MNFGFPHKYGPSETIPKSPSLQWCAPELINGNLEHASEETDIWALGMTILVRRYCCNIWACLTHMNLGTSYQKRSLCSLPDSSRDNTRNTNWKFPLTTSKCRSIAVVRTAFVVNLSELLSNRFVTETECRTNI